MLGGSPMESVAALQDRLPWRKRWNGLWPAFAKPALMMYIPRNSRFLGPGAKGRLMSKYFRLEGSPCTQSPLLGLRQCQAADSKQISWTRAPALPKILPAY